MTKGIDVNICKYININIYVYIKTCCLYLFVYKGLIIWKRSVPDEVYLVCPQNVLWPNHVQFKHRTIQRTFARSLDDLRWFQSIFLTRVFSPIGEGKFDNPSNSHTATPIPIPFPFQNPLEIREWVLALGLCGFPTRESPISWNLQLPSTERKRWMYFTFVVP